MWSLFSRNDNNRDKHSEQSSGSAGAPETVPGEAADEQVTEVYSTEDVSVAATAATEPLNDLSPAVPQQAAPRSSSGTPVARRNASRSVTESEPESNIDYDRIRRDWYAETLRIGGANPLLHFNDSPTTGIDLSTTHPSGLAQFITGQKTLLSSLIRDEVALRRAKAAAGRVVDKATEMRNMRALETVQLGVGIVTWSFEGESFCAPLLLRPLAIRRYGRDFEIKLKRTTTVNPELIRVLREQFGIVVDANTLLELTESQGVFKPQPVIERMRHMAAGIPGFQVQPRLVVSSFNSVATAMAHDLTRLNRQLLRAISGDTAAQKAIRDSYHPVTAQPADSRAAETDQYLYDTDSQQEDVVSQIAAGQSLTVRTLPGTGGTQTVVNAIGELTRAGKRVLIVSPRHATLEGISHRLNRIGLNGLLTTPRRLRRSLVEAIRRNESAEPNNSAEVGVALVRLREILVRYRSALTTKDAELNVSPVQALREMSKFSALPHPPQTTVRLSREALASLALDRSEVAHALTTVARLGQFEYGPDDSPWYGVTFATTEEAKNAYSRAVETAENGLPRLLSMANEMLEQVSLRPYENLHELGAYLNLLQGVRDTLDKFKPEVYNMSLSDVIAAHAPRSSTDTTSNSRRRSLKKLAREYLIPGVTVTDMHAWLVSIDRQRAMWNMYCTPLGAPPEVPLGLGEVATVFADVHDNLQVLDGVLGTQHDADRLIVQPIAELSQRLRDLAQESEVLQNIQERTAIIERLRSAGLGPLLDDLSARHVPAEAVAAELEQAWWQTALENMLVSNPDLQRGDTVVIERLQKDFRLVDDAHCGAAGRNLAAKLADVWRVALIDNRGEAQNLRALLRRGNITPAEVVAAAPNLIPALAPVWAMSPYEVAQLPPGLKFDTVIVADAAALSTVESLGALRRGSQVVAFGDPIIQQPAAFEIGVCAGSEESEKCSTDAAAETSAYAALRSVLPELELTHSYRAGGADLTALVNTKFYENQITTMPWAGTFLGRESLSRIFVADGFALPDEHTGAVESPDAEVERVVQLVLEHAQQRPNESLMVITASKKHAVRVWQAVLSAFAKHREHRDFLLGSHAEPFTVVTLEQATALSRDRVIFSIGYGRTPHGRVLSNFGPLSSPAGDRLIAVAMTRARRAMMIVSCFNAEHLASVSTQPGVAQLAAVIGAEAPEPVQTQLPAEQDPMIVELAGYLTGFGLDVTLNYRGVIPIAAAYAGSAIAVDVDFSDAEDEASLRHTLRLRPALLRRLGWHYHRVQSFDLFQNPRGVALQIARIIGFSPSDNVTEAVTESAAASVTEAVTEVITDPETAPASDASVPSAADSSADTVELSGKLGLASDDTEMIEPLRPVTGSGDINPVSVEAPAAQDQDSDRE